MIHPAKASLLAIALSLSLSIVLLSACQQSAPTPSPDPSPTEDTSIKAKNADHGEDAPDQAMSCVDACIQRNQMRAEAIEKIRQDCATECDQGTPSTAL